MTDVDGSGTITAGDVINFNLHIKNDGNIQLSGLNFTDTNVKRLDNNNTVGNVSFTYQSSSQSNAAGTLISNETEIYSGTYNITASDITARGLSFGVTGQSSSPGQSNDVSDVMTEMMVMEILLMTEILLLLERQLDLLKSIYSFQDIKMLMDLVFGHLVI